MRFEAPARQDWFVEGKEPTEGGLFYREKHILLSLYGDWGRRKRASIWGQMQENTGLSFFRSDMEGYCQEFGLNGIDFGIRWYGYISTDRLVLGSVYWLEFGYLVSKIG